MATKNEPWLPESSAEYERNTPQEFDFEEYNRRSSMRYPNLTQGYKSGRYGGAEKCEPSEPSGAQWDFIRRW